MPSLILAHRGGAGLAPENTLCAFANAIALGADGAELDVHLTRDGQVVVHHDYRLNPDICRNAEGGAWIEPPAPRLRELTEAELAKYDVGRARPGSGYARDHPQLTPADGARIPRLEEVIALAQSAPKPFWLFVELKSCLFDPLVSAPPEELAEATVRVLQSCDYSDRSAMIGFDWRALVRAKALAPALQCWFSTRPQSWFRDAEPSHDSEPPLQPLLALLRQWNRDGNAPWAAGFDPGRYGGSIVDALQTAGADGWFAHFSDATEDAIEQAHAHGLNVGVWTVDDPVLMRTLAGRRVDAICTDRPDLAAAL